MPDEPKLIKICLCNKGEDPETPWAEDLGPAGAKSPAGSRKVRLVNVPFLHAKPTWGDVIIVSPVEDGMLTWDSLNIAWSKIGTRLEDDSGRHAMIVDYLPRGPDADEAFTALHDACVEHEIVCEGAWGPGDDKPGRAYLAVPSELDPVEVMEHLEAAELSSDLIQVHPKPPRAKKDAKKQAAKAAASKSPASKKAASKTPASKTPASKTPASKTSKKPASKTPASKTSKTPASKSPASKTSKTSASKTPASKKPASKTSKASASKKPASQRPASKK